MAIYHLSVQAIGRSAGRSSTAAAAYRAGEKIIDQRTGVISNYQRKRGVLHTQMLLPGGGTAGRAEFWNRIEAHHKRGDAVLSREIEASLPRELSADQRQALALSFAREITDRYGVAADVALHQPHTVTAKDLKKKPEQYWEIDPVSGRRHNGNWHFHCMLSACYVSPADELGKKAVELDPIHCKRAKIQNMVDWARQRWAELANAALEQAGHDARIDHRSHSARGLAEVPGQHQGPAVSGLLARGEQSDVAERQQAERAARESAQLAIARAQATAADVELHELEAQEQAECILLAMAEQQRQADQAAARLAQERAQAEQAQLQEQQRQDALAEHQQAKREQQRLAAHQEHKKAQAELAQAELAESQAGLVVEQLQNACDWAVLGQQEAGKSLLKSAQAVLKAQGWLRDINAYENAIEVLAEARRAVSTARQIVVLAWGSLLALDPAERVALAARQAPQPAPKPAKVVTPAPVPQQAPRAAPAPRQMQDDDREPQGPAPGM